MIDLHAIPIMIFNWIIGWGLFKSYEPTGEFFTLKTFVAGFMFLLSLSPICFGSNKSNINSSLILLNSTIALIIFTKTNVKTDFLDFVIILNSAVLIISPMIFLVWYMIKSNEKELQENN